MNGSKTIERIEQGYLLYAHTVATDTPESTQ